VSDHVFNVSEDEYHQRTAMGRWVIDGNGIRPIGWRSGSVRPKVVGDGPVDPLGKPIVQQNSFLNRDEDPDGDEDQDSVEERREQTECDDERRRTRRWMTDAEVK